MVAKTLLNGVSLKKSHEAGQSKLKIPFIKFKRFPERCLRKRASSITIPKSLSSSHDVSPMVSDHCPTPDTFRVAAMEGSERAGSNCITPLVVAMEKKCRSGYTTPTITIIPVNNVSNPTSASSTIKDGLFAKYTLHRKEPVTSCEITQTFIEFFTDLEVFLPQNKEALRYMKGLAAGLYAASYCNENKSKAEEIVSHDTKHKKSCITKKSYEGECVSSSINTTPNRKSRFAVAKVLSPPNPLLIPPQVLTDNERSANLDSEVNTRNEQRENLSSFQRTKTEQQRDTVSSFHVTKSDQPENIQNPGTPRRGLDDVKIVKRRQIISTDKKRFSPPKVPKLNMGRMKKSSQDYMDEFLGKANEFSDSWKLEVDSMKKRPSQEKCIK